MSHPQQRSFVELASRALAENFNDCKVLEIGSLDINGTVRDFFHQCEYTGVDVAAGKGVDVVCQGQDFGAPDDSFDTVISCEAMEHNPYWKETFRNMVRMCRPGGLIVLTCATYGRREHGTLRSKPDFSPLTAQWEYYRNLAQLDFVKEFDFEELFSQFRFWSNWASYDLYFLGIKRAPSHPYAGFAAAAKLIDEYLQMVHAWKVYRYRQLAGKYLGDHWFRVMRRAVSLCRLSKKNILYILHE